jgi:hypothetical protein
LKFLPKRRQFLFLAIVAILVASLFVPVPYLAAPKWEVVVVDGAGKALEGMTVRSVDQNYSTESVSHEADHKTDSNGQTSFPAHWSSASMARRVIFTVASATAGVHASFGRHATIFAFGKRLEGSAVSGRHIMDWTGAPEEVRTRIKVQPTQSLTQH